MNLASGQRSIADMKGIALLLSSLLLGCAEDLAGGARTEPVTTGYHVGAYYYGRWAPTGPSKPATWPVIQPFPERQPLLGWYTVGTQSIVDQQMNWLADHAVSFVIFDWYWSHSTSSPTAGQNPDAFMRSASKSRMTFTLLYADNGLYPSSWTQADYLADWDAMVEYWISRYFTDPQYEKNGGKPVVYLYGAASYLDVWAPHFGMTPAQMLSRARNAAVAAGYPGIYFVASEGGHYESLAGEGFDAATAYNYRGSTSYSSLTSIYSSKWSGALTATTLPYFVPVTSGWNSKPWRESIKAGRPQEDNSESTPAEFGSHLAAAATFAAANASRTQRTIVVCCFNEFGEGSYIEPTLRWGLKYLEQVKANLGTAEGGADVTGNFDSFDSTGLARGWVMTAAPPITSWSSVSIPVHFYLDGTSSSGTFAGAVLADGIRTDVNRAGYPGNHGFSFSVPPQLRTGSVRFIYPYGVPSTTNLNEEVLVGGSPKTGSQAVPPAMVGGLENLDENGNLIGWVLDPSTGSTSIPVHIYDVANPLTSPTTAVYVGSAITDVLRGDINSMYGVTGNHGFSISLPSDMRDSKSHNFYALAVRDSSWTDELSPTNTMVSGPRSFVTPQP
jgi:hypothetical protein